MSDAPGKPGSSGEPLVSRERWATLEPLIDAALDQPAEQRSTFLNGACGGDAALRAEVDRLLAEFDQQDPLLDHPAAARFASLLDDEPVQLPAVLGERYRMEGEIGHGGMATVYLARDIRHERKVAVKVLHSELAAAVGAERFLAEIKTTAQLQHPHILPLHDSGNTEGVLFYVMPYVEGGSLRRLMTRERQLPLEDAVRIACEVASALDAAHRQGVIHRDIKPENILLQNGSALVADFGIALAVSGAGAPRLTRSGLTVGTPQYMSPEQATGARTIDGRSDIYSLGAVLYEMLAGEPPFTGATTTAVIAKLVALPPPSLRVVRAAIPEAVDAAVGRALAREPADRYRTAGEFGEALKRALVSGASGEEMRRLAAPAVGRRVGVPVIGVVAASLVLLLGGWRWWSASRRAEDARVLAAADTTRIAVFPFEQVGPASGADMVDQAMHQALLRWNGIVVVDPGALRDALGTHRAGALSAAEARSVAIGLRARRYVRGSVGAEAAGLRVHASIYDAAYADAPLAELVATASARGPAFDSAFTRLADRLLFRTPDSTKLAETNVGTNSLPARQAFVRGETDIEQWNLAAADTDFAAAARFDSRYAPAALWLALSRIWAEKDSATWRYAAEAAAAGRSRLKDRDLVRADAVLALARGERPKACALWDALTRRAPSDFAAWYGAADCLARDRLVLPDAGSPSGWRFRSGYHSALTRYRRAFELRPSVLSALRHDGFAQVRRLLKTSDRLGRPGLSSSSPPVWFAAWPSLDHDTLAFYPLPATLISAGDLATMRLIPTTVAAAVQRQRELFRDIATTWASSNTSSADAREALAISLYLLGSSSAIDTLLSAKALAADPIERQRMIGTEVWMRVHVSAPLDLKDLRRARALADSVLRPTTQTTSDVRTLATMAALTGHAFRAEALERIAAPEQILPTPAPLALIERSLVMFGAFGGPTDTLRALEQRADSLINALYRPETRSGVRAQIMGRAALLAFPDHRFSAIAALGKSGIPLLAAQAAFARNDSGAVRQSLADIRRSREHFVAAEAGLDAVYPEAWLLASTGDPTGAIAWLDPTLGSLRLSASLLDPLTAAALVRAMAFRAEVAALVGDSRMAAQWAAAVIALWSGADPFLQPLVQRMRKLVR